MRLTAQYIRARTKPGCSAMMRALARQCARKRSESRPDTPNTLIKVMLTCPGSERCPEMAPTCCVLPLAAYGSPASLPGSANHLRTP